MKKNDFLTMVTEQLDEHNIAYHVTSTPTLPTAVYINYMASPEDSLDFCVDWLNNLPNIEKNLNLNDILETRTLKNKLYVIDLGYWDKESNTHVKVYSYEQFYTDNEFKQLKSKMNRITKGDYEPYE